MVVITRPIRRSSLCAGTTTATCMSRYITTPFERSD